MSFKSLSLEKVHVSTFVHNGETKNDNPWDSSKLGVPLLIVIILLWCNKYWQVPYYTMVTFLKNDAQIDFQQSQTQNNH